MHLIIKWSFGGGGGGGKKSYYVTGGTESEMAKDKDIWHLNSPYDKFNSFYSLL